MLDKDLYNVHNLDIYHFLFPIFCYQIHYYYFDRPCILTGYHKFEFKEGYDPEYDRYFLTKYKNVQFNKGWNQIIIELTDIENERRVFEVSNVNRVKTVWRFIALHNQFTRLP